MGTQSTISNRHICLRFINRLNPAVAGFLATVLISSISMGLAVMAGGNAFAAAKKNSSDSWKGHLPISELTEDEAILHALNRLGYGPRPGDIDRIRQMGLEKWVQQQLNPKSIDDPGVQSRLAIFPTLNMKTADLIEKYPRAGQLAKKEGLPADEVRQRLKQQRTAAEELMEQTGATDPGQLALAKMEGPQRVVAELQMAKFIRAIYSERQLDEVMADFWFNHFNVYAAKAADIYMVTAYDRDVIRPHAMGKFEDLLMATAKSPAMLFYLDNWLSADPVAARKMQSQMQQRRQNSGRFNGGQFQAREKNQERGLNENYGREVMELHTVGVNGGYTQQDVIEMADCLTGWTLHKPQRDPEFYFDDRVHTQGPKTVMGQTFNYGGMRDGEEALRMLARSNSAANFISGELARFFVSDTPPPALVSRMAGAYQKSNGDIPEVLHAMIYSPEFWSRAAFRAKVKMPFQLAVSTARALNANVTVPMGLATWVSRMGQPLYMFQTPNGYSDKAAQWVNTGALLNRLNFALLFANGRMPGARPDLAVLLQQDAGADPNLVLTRSFDIFLGGEVSAQTRSVIGQRMADPQVLRARLDDPVNQVNEGLIAGLVLGSPEFQRR
jgi:uncharacterized protein (DUF1800 family)